MKLLLEQPKRMALERRLLESLARDEAWFQLKEWTATDGGDLCVHFQLALLHGAFDGTLVYPAYFPDWPAYIRPRTPGERWSVHQYEGSGVLCLERGPDNWHESVTGVDLVRSANRLLWNETLRVVVPGSPSVPSRHSATRGQDLRSHNRRFIVTRGLREALNALPSDRAIVLTTSTRLLDTSSTTVVTSVGRDPKAAIEDVPSAAALEGWQRSGWLVRLDSGLLPGRVTDTDGLRAKLGDAWPWKDELDEAVQMLVVCDTHGGLRAFALSGGAEPAFWECKVVDFSGESPSRLPATFTRLSEETVAIVGLGSLGGKIAVSLARAGARSFLLIDDDVLGPENLVRNELDWRSVGFSKVDAVARAIRLVSPCAQVQSLAVGVGAQENPSVSAALGNRLAKSDLVVDATANPNAFVALAALCKRSGTPMVWGELFGGGIGALMARSRPGIDAPPLSVRAHVLGLLDTFDPAPGDEAKESSRYSLESGAQVLVGSDADVTALAAAMTQFALDTLCAGADSEYPVAAYLIGYKKSWAFKQPFDTIPIDCSSAAYPGLEQEPLTPEEDAALVALTAAVERDSGVADNSSS